MSMPTQEEIVERYKAKAKNDMFGFESGDYFNYMDWEHGKEFLKEDANITQEKWEKETPSLIREVVLKEMEDYMEFAWGKAIDCRGISSNRSISHYIAWTWLAGDNEFSEKLEKEYDKNYRYYGKDLLVMICQYYGWDSERWDDRVRVNRESELES